MGTNFSSPFLFVTLYLSGNTEIQKIGGLIPVKKKIAALVGVFLMSLFVFTSSTQRASSEDLLGYADNGEMLGVASAFSVFVKNDFGANGSDCEGRIFAGHSANIGTMEYYSTARSSSASVIVGSGVL